MTVARALVTEAADLKTFPHAAMQVVQLTAEEEPSVQEIEEHGWSLSPGRYVGVAETFEEEFHFFERLEELNEELEVLNHEARELEDRIAANVGTILELEV